LGEVCEQTYKGTKYVSEYPEANRAASSVEKERTYIVIRAAASKMAVSTRRSINGVPADRRAQLVVDRQTGHLVVRDRAHRQAKAVFRVAAGDNVGRDLGDLVDAAEHIGSVCTAELERDGLDGAVGFAQRVFFNGDGFGAGGGRGGEGGAGEGSSKGEEAHFEEWWVEIGVENSGTGN